MTFNWSHHLNYSRAGVSQWCFGGGRHGPKFFIRDALATLHSGASIASRTDRSKRCRGDRFRRSRWSFGFRNKTTGSGLASITVAFRKRPFFLRFRRVFKYHCWPRGRRASSSPVAPNGRHPGLAARPSGKSYALLQGLNPRLAEFPASFTYCQRASATDDIVFHTKQGTAVRLHLPKRNQVNRYRYSPSTPAAARSPGLVVAHLPDSKTPDLGGAYGHELKNFRLGTTTTLCFSTHPPATCVVGQRSATRCGRRSYQYNADGTAGGSSPAGLRNAEGVRSFRGRQPAGGCGQQSRARSVIHCRNSTGKLRQKVDVVLRRQHPPDLFTVGQGRREITAWPFCNSNPDRGFDANAFGEGFRLRNNGRTCPIGGKMDVPGERNFRRIRFRWDSRSLGKPFSGRLIEREAGCRPARSWDRTTPTGIQGGSTSRGREHRRRRTRSDLVTGFLTTAGKARGAARARRGHNGSLLISDDRLEAIYKLTYTPGGRFSARGSGAARSRLDRHDSRDESHDGNGRRPVGDWPTSLGGATITVQDSAAQSAGAHRVCFSGRS